MSVPINLKFVFVDTIDVERIYTVKFYKLNICFYRYMPINSKMSVPEYVMLIHYDVFWLTTRVSNKNGKFS